MYTSLYIRLMDIEEAEEKTQFKEKISKINVFFRFAVDWLGWWLDQFFDGK